MTTKSHFFNDTTYSDQITITVGSSQELFIIVALLLHSENLDVTKRGTVAPGTKLQTVCLLTSLHATTLAITFFCHSTSFVPITVDQYHQTPLLPRHKHEHPRKNRPQKRHLHPPHPLPHHLHLHRQKIDPNPSVF